MLRKVSKYVIIELRNLCIFLTKPPTRVEQGQWPVTLIGYIGWLGEQATK